MNHVFGRTLAAVLLLAGASAWAAQPATSGLQPIAAIGFRGYDELKNDIQFVGEAGGNPGLGAMADFFLMQQLGDAAGKLDRTRPWGLVVQTDGQGFFGYAFLPVSDVGGVLKALEPRLGRPTREGALYRFEAGQQSILLKQQGTWAVLSNSAESLATVPSDPVKLLGGLEKQYDVVVRLAVKNIPPSVRQMLMLPIQMGMQQAMQKLPNESDQQHQLRIKMSQQSLDQMNTALEELDVFQLGLDIDRQAKKAVVEYSATAKPGTKLAKQMAAAGANLNTQYAGFFQPKSAMAFSAVSQLPPESIEQMKNQFSAARVKAEQDLADNSELTDEHREQAKKLLGTLFEALEATIEKGRIDAAASVALQGKSPTLVAGGQMVDTQKVEDVIKQVAELATKEEPSLSEAITLNAGEHAGVKLHELNVPVEALGDAAADLQKIFGDTINVVIGVGPQSLYLATGADASAALGQAIDASAKQGGQVPPTRFSVAVGQVVDFAAGVSEGDAQQAVEMVRRTLAQKPGKDHITMTGSVIPNGQRVRLEMEEGILALLGALPTLIQSMQGR